MRKLLLTFLIMTMTVTMFSCGPDVRQQALKNAEGSMNIGHAYLISGDYTAGLGKLLEAEKVIHDDPYLENDLGLAFMAKKRFALAAKHFQLAVKLKSDYIPARNNLGTAYMEQKKWDSAIACFKAISGNLLYATPHYPLSNMGWAYIEKKEYRLAEKNFSKALKLSPEFIQAVHGLATVYIKTGNGYHAINFLNRKIKKKPGAVILHADLAKAYEMVHQFSDAERSWQTVIKLAPGSGPAEEAEAHINKLKSMQ